METFIPQLWLGPNPFFLSPIYLWSYTVWLKNRTNPAEADKAGSPRQALYIYYINTNYFWAVISNERA